MQGILFFIIREWEEKETYPADLHEKAYRAGVYGYFNN
jgi:hypothetical protein